MFIVISKESDSSGNLNNFDDIIDIDLARIVLFTNDQKYSRNISTLAIQEGFEVTTCSDFTSLQNLIKSTKFDSLICDVPSSSLSLEELLGWVSKLGNSKPYLILSIARNSEINFSKFIHYEIDEFIYNDSKDEEIRLRFKLIEARLKKHDYLTQKFSKLRRDRKRYESLFIESPEAMLVLQNRQGKVIGVNRSVKAVLGYDGKALLGKYMSLIFKRIIFAVTFNSSLFLLLMIGIQNSSNKSRINLLINETVKLPISFIIGTSFISGSVIGSLLTTEYSKKKD